MARFRGEIGFVNSALIEPGVYESEVISEKRFIGDLLAVSKKWAEGEKINDDLELSMRVSIVLKPNTDLNIGGIKYVRVYGTCWKVVKMEVKHPRLILTIGGVYNGPTKA